MSIFKSAARPNTGYGVVKGILQAAEFADLDEEDKHKHIRGWTKASLKKAKALAYDFRCIAGSYMIDLALVEYEKIASCCDYTAQEALGHDIWFSCQGHGVGFGDRDGKNIQALQPAALTMRHRYEVFRMPNGWLRLD